MNLEEKQCPMCGFTPSLHDRVNKHCATSFEKPDHKLPNGYRVFFRGYVPSATNLLLIGLALAWRTSGDPHYFCVAGTNEIHSYEAGDDLYYATPETSRQHYESDMLFRSALLYAKKEAVDALAEHVKEVQVRTVI